MKVFTWTKYQQKYFSISALASKISQLKKIMADYHVNLSSNIIICFLIRAEIQKYFHWFLVQMKTSKFAFRINWHLFWTGVLDRLGKITCILHFHNLNIFLLLDCKHLYLHPFPDQFLSSWGYSNIFLMYLHKLALHSWPGEVHHIFRWQHI